MWIFLNEFLRAIESGKGEPGGANRWAGGSQGSTWQRSAGGAHFDYRWKKLVLVDAAGLKQDQADPGFEIRVSLAAIAAD